MLYTIEYSCVIERMASRDNEKNKRYYVTVTHVCLALCHKICAAALRAVLTHNVAFVSNWLPYRRYRPHRKCVDWFSSEP